MSEAVLCYKPFCTLFRRLSATAESAWLLQPAARSPCSDGDSSAAAGMTCYFNTLTCIEYYLCGRFRSFLVVGSCTCTCVRLLISSDTPQVYRTVQHRKNYTGTYILNNYAQLALPMRVFGPRLLCRCGIRGIDVPLPQTICGPHAALPPTLLSPSNKKGLIASGALVSWLFSTCHHASTFCL